MWIETTDNKLVNLDFVRTLEVSRGSVVCNCRKEHICLNHNIGDENARKLLDGIYEAIGDGLLVFSVPWWIACHITEQKS